MANLNKVMLIGRLTRDPEIKSFNQGTGKVATFGFAVNNNKKNSAGEWENEPVFIDVSVFNRDKYKLADMVEENLAKGRQIYLEGRLQLDQWTDKDGQKRSKLKLIGESFQYLDKKDDEGGRKPYLKPGGSQPISDEEIPF